MKLALFALIGFMTAPAFAYGTRVSTGKGFACQVSATVLAVDRNHCRAHVASESKPEPLQRDVNGHRYTTITQVIDNADCLETTLSADYAAIDGDLSVPVGGYLGSLQNLSLSTSPKYNNNAGSIDSETRHGVLFYIYKDVDPSADQDDQTRLSSAFARSFQAIQLNYDPAALTLSFEVIGHEGHRKYVRPANFAAGQTARQPAFSASITETLPLGGPARVTKVTLSCEPLSVHHP